LFFPLNFSFDFNFDLIDPLEEKKEGTGVRRVKKMMIINPKVVKFVYKRLVGLEGV